MGSIPRRACWSWLAAVRISIWELGDLRSIRFDGEFDLIVMTGHAFQTLVTEADLRGALIAIRRPLTHKGRFAFETRNPLARAWEGWRPENAVEVIDPYGDVVRITTTLVKPLDGGVVSFTHTFIGPNPNLPLVSESTLRFLGTDELVALLAGAGLVIAEQFGDFEKGPTDECQPRNHHHRHFSLKRAPAGRR